LFNTIRKEKKRKKREKPLNLVSKEDPGAQFYSFRVQATKAFAAAKKAEKESRKAKAAENKQKRKAEAEEKALYVK
jgi:hypothetical protein